MKKAASHLDRVERNRANGVIVSLNRINQKNIFDLKRNGRGKLFTCLFNQICVRRISFELVVGQTDNELIFRQLHFVHTQTSSNKTHSKQPSLTKFWSKDSKKRNLPLAVSSEASKFECWVFSKMIIAENIHYDRSNSGNLRVGVQHFKFIWRNLLRISI